MAKIINLTESLIQSNREYTKQWEDLPESKANIPILTNSHGKETVATVSVVKYDKRYYFITANHCLENENQQEIRLDANLSVDVNAELWSRAACFDVAFLPLTGEVEQYIAECGKYMELANSPKLIELSKMRRHFFMAGFPASKNKKSKRTKKLKRYITYMQEREELLTGDTIFCSFDKQNYFDEDGNSILCHHHPAGNSGGPLIYVTSFEGALVQEEPNFVFSGILIEACPSNKNVLKFASALLLGNILK